MALYLPARCEVSAQLSRNPCLRTGDMWKLLAIAAFAVFQTASAEIYHLCPLNDWACVGRILAYNSHCKPVASPQLESTHYEKFFRFETPNFNASYEEHDLKIRNMDKCFVSAFYFNGTSDTCVLSIDCPDLGFEADRVYFQHHSLREDQVYHYSINATYPLVRLTTTMPHAHHLDLCSAFTFGDVAGLPSFHIDPKDRKTDNFLTRDLSLLYVYERETFFWRAPRIFRYFTNLACCDFGCW